MNTIAFIAVFGLSGLFILTLRAFFVGYKQFKEIANKWYILAGNAISCIIYALSVAVILFYMLK